MQIQSKTLSERSVVLLMCSSQLTQSLKSTGRGLRGQFKSEGLSWRSQISRFQLFRELCWRTGVHFALSYKEMSSLRTFDSATTLTVTEGYDVTKQEHYYKKRCSCSCCDWCHRRCTFRVWQILLFLFIVAVIIAGLALLLAMFGPGNTDLKYSASVAGTHSPDNTGKQIFSC